MAQKKLENLWQKVRKQMLNDVTVFNIREYVSAKGDKDLGEDELRQLLSEFFCDKNRVIGQNVLIETAFSP